MRVFSCAGCGSEWVRAEAWTPADADGDVAADVAAERAQPDGQVSSGPGEGGAGSAGS